MCIILDFNIKGKIMSSNSSSSGISFGGVLTILFIALKLMGKIDWSWWWVLSPIWIPIVIVLAVAILAISKS